MLKSVQGKLTARQLQVLELLARYYYLTVSQFIRLGIAAYPSGVSRVLAALTAGNRPLIRAVSWSKTTSIEAGKRLPPRRQEAMYFLLSRGVKMLQAVSHHDQPLKPIRYPRQRPAFARDYDHRKATIDFHIEVSRFAERFNCFLPWFECYFDFHRQPGLRGGTSPYCQTKTVLDAGSERCRYPDCLFTLVDPDQGQHLFAVEVQRGRELAPLMRKVFDHYLEIIHGNLIGKQRGLAHLPCRLLMVFEESTLLEKFLASLSAHPLAYKLLPFIACKTIAEVKGSSETRTFALDWHFHDGRKRVMFG